MDFFDIWLSGNDIFTSGTLSHYWNGFVTTVQLVVLSLIFGLIFSVPVAVLRDSRNHFISKPIWFYIYVFRGTPLLIQLYIIYYGLAFIEGIQESIFWFVLKEPFYPALITFFLNTTAYTAEIVRGAIRQTPKGEIEAAKACGMSKFKIFFRIVLPSALRRALPAYSNEVIFVLHATSIASVVTIVDITGAARDINARFYAPFEAYIFAAMLYLGLTFLVVWWFGYLEKRFLHLRN